MKLIEMTRDYVQFLLPVDAETMKEALVDTFFGPKVVFEDNYPVNPYLPCVAKIYCAPSRAIEYLSQGLSSYGKDNPISAKDRNKLAFVLYEGYHAKSSFAPSQYQDNYIRWRAQDVFNSHPRSKEVFCALNKAYRKINDENRLGEVNRLIDVANSNIEVTNRQQFRAEVVENTVNSMTCGIHEWYPVHPKLYPQVQFERLQEGGQSYIMEMTLMTLQLEDIAKTKTNDVLRRVEKYIKEANIDG